MRGATGTPACLAARHRRADRRRSPAPAPRGPARCLSRPAGPSQPRLRGAEAMDGRAAHRPCKAIQIQPSWASLPAAQAGRSDGATALGDPRRARPREPGLRPPAHGPGGLAHRSWLAPSARGQTASGREELVAFLGCFLRRLPRGSAPFCPAPTPGSCRAGGSGSGRNGRQSGGQQAMGRPPV